MPGIRRIQTLHARIATEHFLVKAEIQGNLWVEMDAYEVDRINVSAWWSNVVKRCLEDSEDFKLAY